MVGALSLNIIKKEMEHGAQHTSSLPVVFDKASDIFVWDPEGNRYYDFLSCYACVNQGHCHPKIIDALVKQASKCTLSSRAFYNTELGKFEEKLCQLTGYERCLTMNTGVEAVEAAIKLTRRWGYTVKNIPENQAIILTATGNFHGRTITAISMSTDPICHDGFGPHVPLVSPFINHMQFVYNDISSFVKICDQYHSIMAGVLLEPIQGEAGIIVPDEDFISEVYHVCQKYNILLIMDEIQTGLGRTGKLFAHHYDQIKPDIVLCGKALSGGVLPLSAVLADSKVMLVLQPGHHGSTFGGNPLAAAVGCAALDVLMDQNLIQNAMIMGKRMKQELLAIQKQVSFIKHIRGKGLLQAIELYPHDIKTGKALALLLISKGFLTKPTHGHILRLAPPLTINLFHLLNAMKILEQACLEFEKQ